MHFLIHSQRNQFENECLNVSLTNWENAWEPSNTTESRTESASIWNILIYTIRKHSHFTITTFISFKLNIFCNSEKRFTEKYIFKSKLHLFVTNSIFKSILYMFQVSGIWHSLYYMNKFNNIAKVLKKIENKFHNKKLKWINLIKKNLNEMLAVKRVLLLFRFTINWFKILCIVNNSFLFRILFFNFSSAVIL